ISRLFARTLSLSIIDSGSRIEMVRVVGRRVGSLTRPAWRQSTNSVESCDAQKSRSWYSFLNFGILRIRRFTLGMLILLPFALPHSSSRDHPDQPFAYGKDYKQQTPFIGLAQRIEPRLSL